MKAHILQPLYITLLAMLLSACHTATAHFSTTGASSDPLPPHTPVALFTDGPPMPPFEELGVLSIPCQNADRCIARARIEARRHGGNVLVLLSYEAGLVKYMLLHKHRHLLPRHAFEQQ